ncbi:MAG: hypothetical protein ACP5H2_12245 [Solirubrobacteraceae bacterium]
MAVQPPLEHKRTAPEDADAGVIEDARIRQRRQRTIGAALLAAVFCAGILVLGFGGGGNRHLSGRSEQRRPPSKPAATNSSLRPVVLIRGLRNAQAYAADGRLYVVEQVNAFGAAPIDELWRVNPATGRILATRALGGTYSQALRHGGSLWITTTRGARSWLWRLDPDSLVIRAKLLLGTSGDGYGEAAPTMAVAGGWLWVGDMDQLLRVSPVTARITSEIPVPHAGGVDVASDSNGFVLVDSEGRETAFVQRRDPVNGTLLKQSAPIQSIARPYIGGVYKDSLWISNSGGHAGYVERFSLTTLKPTAFAGSQPHPGVMMPPAILGGGGITAEVIDGTLWVTQTDGGTHANYCGNPLTGVSRAPLKLDGQADLLTVGSGRIYYLPVASVRNETLKSVAASQRC